MPPLTRIRIPALRELVEQQRFTPSRALVRQIDRGEALAGEIDPTITYPEDWVVFRITGFRPDMPNPRMIPGEALRADLSALVERLSDHARLARASVGEALTGAELEARWSVSRKTIERYRRRGLVGRRVSDGPGPTRLVFSRRAVEAFEREHAGRLASARGFERLSEGERRTIVARAQRYHARLGWTRNQIIGRLAERLGRSRETIRRALEHEGGGVPVGARLAPDEVRAIVEGERAGERPSEIAARFGRSRASIHRIVNTRRGDLLRRLDLSAPGELGADAARAIDEAPAREGLGAAVLLDPVAWVEESRHALPEPAGIERTRALACHALRARARTTIAGLARNNPSSDDLDRAETDLRWATLLKRSLAHGERALVLRTLEERLGVPLLQLPPERVRELHRAAFETVLGVIDRYLPVRGGRLAAPVSLALGRAMARLAEGAEPIPGARATRRRSAGAPDALHDWTAEMDPWQAWLDPPRGVARVVAELEDEAGRVVVARFGLSGRRPMTFGEIEAELGVGRRRAVALVRDVIRRSVAVERR